MSRIIRTKKGAYFNHRGERNEFVVARGRCQCLAVHLGIENRVLGMEFGHNIGVGSKIKKRKKGKTSSSTIQVFPSLPWAGTPAITW